jgi:hypothetical protein
MQYKDCVHYYQTHRFSDEHAHAKCRDYHARAEDEAATLASQWRAIIELPAAVEARLKATVETNWVWRLPYNANNPVAASYSKRPNRWTTPEAMTQVFPAVVGKVDAPGQYAKAWQYTSSGSYQAAREILPNVGFDVARAADLAVAAAAAGFQRDLHARWDAETTAVRDYWLGQWFPTPAGASTYGCPNAPLTKPCAAQVVATFEKVCLPAVRAAHVNAPNELSAAVRTKDAEGNCRSWIDPQLAKATAIGSFNLGPMNAQLCGAMPERSEEAGRCLRRVSDAYLECAMDAIAANQGVAQVEACLANAKPGIAARNLGARPVPAKPVTAPVQAPGPAGVPVQVPAPASAPRAPAPAPRATPTPPQVRAPAPSQPVRIAPTAPATSGRPPPPVAEPEAPPACPRGQVRQTRRDGVVECVVRGG